MTIFANELESGSKNRVKRREWRFVRRPCKAVEDIWKTVRNLGGETGSWFFGVSDGQV
jgi:hypothetical protein